MPTQYLNLPGIKIAYSEAGSGQNLLLLHGNSESKKIFTLYQSNYFSEFHTYAPDSRGHGQSQSVDSEYSIQQYCNDTIAFCQSLNIEKTNLIGYSDGANIGLLLARDAPQLFNRVILVSPNYLVSGTDKKTLEIFTLTYKIWLFLSRLGLPTRKAAMRYALMLNDIGISAEEMKSIRLPVKIIYAEKEMIKEDHILEIAGYISNAEVERITGATHMNILQQPAAVTAMQAYLAQ